jgi:Rrf2 family protein
VRISAKVDYAVRAMAELAAVGPDEVLRAETIADSQDVPAPFLLAVLGDLRQAQLVRSTRGRHGGYSLARPAEEITVADVVRAVEGPLANIRDTRLRDLRYEGAAEHLVDIWRAVRTALREVMETVTLADLVSGRLPESVREMALRYVDEEARRHAVR